MYTPCFSVKIAELAVLRLDLPSVDLRVMLENVLPPLLLVHLFQVNEHDFLIFCSGQGERNKCLPRQIKTKVAGRCAIAILTHGPCAIVHLDRLA